MQELVCITTLGCLLILYLVVCRICNCIETSNIAKKFKGMTGEDCFDYVETILQQIEEIGAESIDISGDVIKVKLKNGDNAAFITNSDEIKEKFKNYKDSM